jgi:hypothetical protein
MIKIILPVQNIDEAVAIRDRIQGQILVVNETAYIGDGGVVIVTDDPVRVCSELEADGFEFDNW